MSKYVSGYDVSGYVSGHVCGTACLPKLFIGTPSGTFIFDSQKRALLDGRISCEDRALLKLDLETHELPALTGAESLLEKVETVLTEVSFYDANDSGAPCFAEIVAFLRKRRFLLYEVASLSGRARDGRLRMGDAVFVRDDSALSRDTSWS